MGPLRSSFVFVAAATLVLVACTGPDDPVAEATATTSASAVSEPTDPPLCFEGEGAPCERSEDCGDGQVCFRTTPSVCASRREHIHCTVAFGGITLCNLQCTVRAPH